MYSICNHCGESFEGRPNRAYCSQRCKAAINNRRYTDRDKEARAVELKVRANRNILSKLYQVFGNKVLPKATIEKSSLASEYKSGTSRDGTHFFFLDFIIKWLPSNDCQILKITEL